mgnify:CR=1 FL=1
MAFDKDAFLTALDSMTVMELNDLVKAIEEKFGVSAAAMAAPAAGGRGFPPSSTGSSRDGVALLRACSNAARKSSAHGSSSGCGPSARLLRPPSGRPAPSVSPTIRRAIAVRAIRSILLRSGSS